MALHVTELGRSRWLWLLVGPLIGAGLIVLLVPDRSDRLGHYLAGFGASLGAAWIVALLAKGRPWLIVAATLACIGLGHLVERFVFPLGGYDILDVAAQSGGAVQAGLALVVGRAGDPEDDWFDVDRFTPSPYGRAIAVLAGVTLVVGGWAAFR